MIDIPLSKDITKISLESSEKQLLNKVYTDILDSAYEGKFIVIVDIEPYPTHIVEKVFEIVEKQGYKVTKWVKKRIISWNIK